MAATEPEPGVQSSNWGAGEDALVVATPEGALLEVGLQAGAAEERTAAPSRSLISAVAAMIPGSVASMNIGLQPILFGALVEAKRITPAQLGRVATLEIFALALGALIIPRILRRGRVRLVTAGLAVALALIDVAAFLTTTPMEIYAVKTLSGLFAGGLAGVTVFLITHTAQPDRMTSAYQAVSTVPQMVGNYLLASFLNPRFGSYSGFGLMAALAVVAACSSAVLPTSVRISVQRKARWNAPRLPVLLVLLAILTENAAIGAVWDYLEQVGHIKGFPGAVAGGAVAGLLGFQLLGAMTAAWVGWRLDNRSMLLGCCAFLWINTLAICFSGGAISYVAAACIFGFVQIFLYPYGVKLLVELDPTRQTAVLMTPLSFIGTALGPLLCSWWVRPNDVTPAYWIAGAVMLVTGSLYALTYRLAPRPLRWLSVSPRPDRMLAH